MLYTIITILSVLVVASLFVIYNLLQKLEKYEDIIEDNDVFLQTELERNEALLEALREIDSREMFEKDDEVGSIFYQIKETIEKFKTQQNAN
jgi:cell division protein ZapA (FtsZ GTPase activity inhibitor)